MQTHLPSRPASTCLRWTAVLALALASSLTACDKSRDGSTGAGSASPPASGASR